MRGRLSGNAIGALLIVVSASSFGTLGPVIRYADQALLAAKSSGRDRITDYEALV